MTRHVLALLAALAATSAPLAARADGGIVLETYTGEKPADATRLVAPLLEELAQHKYQSGDTVARRYDASSRAAITTGLPADFAAQVDRGYDTWLAGKFDQTIAQLAPLVDAEHANPGVAASDTGPRDALPKALVALALAHQRSGDPAGAKAALAELVRAFPDVAVTRATYGPEAADLFAQAQRDVAAAGKGKLEVKVGDPTAQIFVDERATPTSGSWAMAIPPGEYRVFAKVSGKLTRAHRVVVRANETATLALDLALDFAVRTQPFVGLELASAPEREAHEGELAVAIAKQIGAESVVLVGIDQVRGRPSVVASLVSMDTGREIRRASVASDPDPSTDRLRALARFVAGSEPDPDIEVLLPTRGTLPVAPPPAVASHEWGGWKWVATGIAVAGLGAGATLVGLDGTCAVTEVPGRPCTDLRQTATPGYVSLSIGGAAAVAAVYLFLRGGGGGDAGEAKRTVFVAPSRGGAFAGISASF